MRSRALVLASTVALALTACGGGQDDTAAVTPADLLKRALRLLVETQGEPWVSEAAVWHMIKRLDPTFDTKDHGYASFPDMVQAFDAWVEVRMEGSGPSLRLR